MSGVSIDPPAPAINPNVLMEILSANETVQARITEYTRVKAEADKSLAALKIGSDAHKAYADANTKSAAADAKMAEAQKHADQAIQTLGDAQGRAQDLAANAQAKHEKTLAEIERDKANHAQFIDNSKADLAAKQKQLDAALASVEKDKAAAQSASAAAKAAQEDANKAKASAKAAELDFKERAAKLHDALGRITAS